MSATGQGPDISAAHVYRGFIDAVNRQDLEEAARFVDAARYRENCVGFTQGFVDWEEAKTRSAGSGRAFPTCAWSSTRSSAAAIVQRSLGHSRHLRPEANQRCGLPGLRSA